MERGGLVYGWVEQNEACWGIESRRLEDDETVEKVEPDGRLAGILKEGEWFASFSESKKAAAALWKKKLDTARMAYRDIRRLKKGDIVRGNRQ